MAGEPDPKQKKTRKLGASGATQKKKKPILVIGGEKFNVIPGSENAYSILDKADVEVIEKKASGGRIGLRGGGICKKGMNRKAVGKNS